jgi:hypothetical protein
LYKRIIDIHPFERMTGREVHLTDKQIFKLVSLLIGVTLVAGVVIFCNLNRAAVDNELINLDLIPKPETMTELYFNNNAKLPSSAPENRVISFTFVIHNLEMTNYQYAYEITVNTNGTRHIIDSGNILVKNNQYYIKNEQFKLANASEKQEVVVELLNKQQSIDFWIGDSK